MQNLSSKATRAKGNLPPDAATPIRTLLPCRWNIVADFFAQRGMRPGEVSKTLNGLLKAGDVSLFCDAGGRLYVVSAEGQL